MLRNSQLFTFISLSYQDLWSMVADNPEQDHNNVHRVGHPGGGAQTGLPPYTLPGKVSRNNTSKFTGLIDIWMVPLACGPLNKPPSVV